MGGSATYGDSRISATGMDEVRAYKDHNDRFVTVVAVVVAVVPVVMLLPACLMLCRNLPEPDDSLSVWCTNGGGEVMHIYKDKHDIAVLVVVMVMVMVVAVPFSLMLRGFGQHLATHLSLPQEWRRSSNASTQE